MQMDVARMPHLWAEMDKVRQQTGGWWENMKTLRVRLSDSVLEEDDFTEIEINIKFGHIQGIRLLNTGVHSTRLRRGPHLMWAEKEMVDWFTEEESSEEEHPVLCKEVWVGYRSPQTTEYSRTWVGVQLGLFEVLRAFT